MSVPHSRKFPLTVGGGVVPTTVTVAGPAVVLREGLADVTVAALEMEDVDPVTMEFNARVAVAPDAMLAMLQVTVDVTTGLHVKPEAGLTTGTFVPDVTRSAWPGRRVSVTVTPVTVAPVLLVMLMYQVRLSLARANVAGNPLTVYVFVAVSEPA